MPFRRWLESLSTHTREQKLATVVASLALVVVVYALISTLLQEQKEPEKNQPRTAVVKVYEKPDNISAQSLSSSVSQSDTHTKTAKPKPSPAPAQIKTAKPKSVTPKPPASKPVVSKTTAPKPTTKKQIVIGQGTFFIQVGAFNQPNLARLMYEKMQKKYKHAKINLRSKLYAVWVGPVSTHKEAEQLEQHIQRRDNIKGFIVEDK